MTNLLTTKEAAAELRISKTRILNLIHETNATKQHLTHVGIGRRILIRRETLDQFVRDCEKSS